MVSHATPSRRDLLIVATTFLVIMIGTTLPAPLYALYQREYGFGEAWTTIIFAVYAGGVIAALLVFGSWSDQLGRRPLLWAGMAMAALSALLFLLTDSVTGLLVARLFSGFSAGITTGTATVAVIEATPPRWKSAATLTATAANMLGLGLGPLLAGWVSRDFPWPLTLIFWVHLVLLLGVALALLAVPETARRPRRPVLSLRKPAIPPAVRATFIPAAIAGLAAFSVTGLFTSVVPSIMSLVLGEDDGVLIGGVIFLLFAGSVAGQALLEKIPPDRQMLAGCIGLMLGMLLLGLSIWQAALPLLITSGLVAGIGQGIVFRAGMGAVTAKAPADQKAAVTSALFVVFYLSISFPVVGLGFAAEAMGLRPASEAFSLVVALVALLAMIATGWVQASQRRSTPGA